MLPRTLQGTEQSPPSRMTRPHMSAVLRSRNIVFISWKKILIYVPDLQTHQNKFLGT